MLPNMAKHRPRAKRINLEVYAFWTGFLSTIISLVHVIVLAMRSS